MERIPPKQFLLQLQDNLDRELEQRGNTQNTRPLNVFQRVRTENICRDGEKIESRELNDIINKGLQEPAGDDRYIQYVSATPSLVVIMHSVKQLGYVNDKTNFIYMDATGSVTRNPYIKNVKYKKPFYYVMVVSVRGETLPINEMIATDHSTNCIRLFVSKLRDLIRKEKKKVAYS